MSRRSHSHSAHSQRLAHSELAEAVARVLVEDGLTDYRLARQKVADRYGLSPRSGFPDNPQIHQALIDYQRLYGGRAYAEQLIALRRNGVEALRLLAEFRPRVVGGVVSGAITDGSRVQIHCICDQAEAIEIFLDDRRVPIEQGERDYRFPDGRSERIPMIHFEAGAVGVDIAVFAPQTPTPISPTEGGPFKRVGLEALIQLAEQPLSSLILVG